MAAEAGARGVGAGRGLNGDVIASAREDEAVSRAERGNGNEAWGG